MDLIVNQGSDGTAQARHGARRWRCAIGRGGLRHDKREGDGATPIGSWPMRLLYYRADRIRHPSDTALDVRPLRPTYGWCDDPARTDYNRLVRLPFDGSHEVLWRSDPVYDLIIVLGYNDNPPVAGKGSAIFLHLAKPDYPPTEGCIALARAHLLSLLEAVERDSRVTIVPPR